MKGKILAVAVLTLVSTVLAVASNPVYEAAAKTTHHIWMNTFLDRASCSATAIGPHALLTASHCEEPTDKVLVDGDETRVLGILRDDKDHSILLVEQHFTRYASFATEKPKQGDDVFIFGNPAGKLGIFRKGYVAGFDKQATNFLEEAFGGGEDEIYYDFNGWMGDSGGAIFDATGKIQAVVSVADLTPSRSKDWPTFKLMGAFPLAFTPEQIKQATAFLPGPSEKKPVQISVFPSQK